MYGGFAWNRLEDAQVYDAICHILTNINIRGCLSQERSFRCKP